MNKARDIWRVTVSMRSRMESMSKFCNLLGQADTVQDASDLALKQAKKGLGKHDADDLYVTHVEHIGTPDF